MSGNFELQKEKEKACLNQVINNFKSENCFGMINEEKKYLKNLLVNAESNNSGTTFPDFIIKSGFIEHFEITSSIENKKGAKQKRESIKFANQSEKNFHTMLDNTPEDEYKSLVFHRNFEKHSQQNIRNSIRKNWEKHIKSYENYKGEKENSVFLLEYSNLGMLETAEILNDDSAIGKVYRSYRVTLDKRILEWIYQYKDKIKYFILYNSESTEIIRIDEIPIIKESLPESMILPTFGMESHSYHPITFKLE